MSTATLEDVDTIADLDFEPTCEHSQHHDCHAGDEPAAYIVRVRCSGCDDGGLLNLCQPGYDCEAGKLLHCAKCDSWDDRDECWQIVYTFPSRGKR